MICSRMHTAMQQVMRSTCTTTTCTIEPGDFFGYARRVVVALMWRVAINKNSSHQSCC